MAFEPRVIDGGGEADEGTDTREPAKKPTEAMRLPSIGAFWKPTLRKGCKRAALALFMTAAAVAVRERPILVGDIASPELVSGFAFGAAALIATAAAKASIRIAALMIALAAGGLLALEPAALAPLPAFVLQGAFIAAIVGLAMRALFPYEQPSNSTIE